MARRSARLRRQRAVLFTLGGIFGGAVAVIFIMTGSVATTGLIVLGWLAAGLAVSLLMARSR